MDTESATLAIVVLNSLAIAGNAGKYISMENGVMVLSAPRIRIRKKFCCLLRFSKTILFVLAGTK